MTDPRYLTSEEMATRYRISKNTVVTWRKEGTGPKAVKVGRTYRYPLTEIIKYEAAIAKEAGIPEDIRPELEAFAQSLGLTIDSPGILMLSQVLTENERLRAEGNDSTGPGVA